MAKPGFIKVYEAHGKIDALHAKLNKIEKGVPEVYK